MCQVTVHQVNSRFIICHFPAHKSGSKGVFNIGTEVYKGCRKNIFFPLINKITLHDFNVHGNLHGPTVTFKVRYLHTHTHTHK